MAAMTETKWYSDAGEGRITCELCPRACTMKKGDRGFCFVRQNVDGRMVLDTYGKSTGFCIDPIEKKPLNHFLPGTPVLSFGTAGCNLGCKFCQNWDISKSREVARLSEHAMPMEIALAAQRTGCRSVAFTYNDPVIWAEYAIDTARACHELGLKAVAVTAGYLNDESRRDFFSEMDAANIDLKAFEEDFYYKLTSSHLQPVLDTIKHACNETDCWVELTNLIIPDANDSESEIWRMCEWILKNIGPDVPTHFTAFHPDFRMTDRPRTSHEKLIMAYDVAKESGLNYVYVGNVHDVTRQSTTCHGCGEILIQRDWHQLGVYALSNDKCSHCGVVIPGVFEDRPGDWGAKRQPIRIHNQPRPAEQLVQLGHALTPQVTQQAIQPTKQAEKKMEAADITRLSETQQQTIQRAACDMILAAVEGGDPNRFVSMLGELQELLIHGVFVTAKRGATLRGCCGRQGQVMKLGQAMADSAGRTARDPRMAPLSRSELPFLDLSISLLGPKRPIGASGDAREQAVEIGTHGLRIQSGQHAGLLLPQVAVEQGWNARQFLDAVCRKASLPAGTWRKDEVELMLFDGVYFGEGFEMGDESLAVSSPLIPAGELQDCRNWIASNLISLQNGAMPMYYAMGVSDQEVLGIVLSVEHPQCGGQQWLHLSTRELRPMQSSLYQMTQQAAAWLGPQFSAADCQVDVAILSDCVHRGSVAEADMRGMKSSVHAAVVTDGRRWSVCFQSDSDMELAIQNAKELEQFRGAEQLYSMQCDSTARVVSVSVGPRAVGTIAARPSAVAGRFYPAEDESREAELDRMMEGLSESVLIDAFAIMVPHAGLRFSGRVAGDVWRRLKPPQRMLIIGPKHTAEGVDWAVAPHDRWMMNASTSIAGDIDMSKDLADALPMMELDSVAHAREHGIEIQLPFINRYFPDAKIAAIAMSGGAAAQIESLADALAEWMNGQKDPPLLVVSSDMNHYADDEENRRRDRLALDALAGGDGEALLKVCADENISMCGQIPAALTLMVMRRLGIASPAQEINYATSAEFGGDKGKVVGYAGVIWAK